MPKPHSTLVDGLREKEAEKWHKWQLFRIV